MLRAAPRTYPLDIPEGCILYYDMEDAGTVIRDHSLSLRDGAITECPLQVGPAGNVRYFDGSNDIITAGNTTSLEFATPISIEMWVKPADTTKANQGLVSKWTASGTLRVFTLNQNQTTLAAITSPDGGVGALDASSFLNYFTQGVWHHVVVTYSGTTLTAYKNGAAFGSPDTSLGATIAAQSVAWTFGKWASTFYIGQMGVVRIYNKILNAQEVEDAYNENAWRYGLAERN